MLRTWEPLSVLPTKHSLLVSSALGSQNKRELGSSSALLLKLDYFTSPLDFASSSLSHKQIVLKRVKFISFMWSGGCKLASFAVAEPALLMSIGKLTCKKEVCIFVHELCIFSWEWGLLWWVKSSQAGRFPRVPCAPTGKSKLSWWVNSVAIT